MKIELSPGAGFYTNKKPVGACKDTAPSVAGKTDVAEFSRGAGAIPDKTMLGIKTAIQSEVGANASAVRLEELRQSIRDGAYEIPSRAIASAILGSE